jgi:hypothetical protein
MFPGIDDPASLHRGAWRYFPVAPGRMEFAMAVRKSLLEDRPQIVAVELPSVCETQIHRAVERLPQFSVLLYPLRPENGLHPLDHGEEEDDESTMLYVPVEPADPFLEAVRTAREIGAQVILIEPSFGEKPHVSGLYPDSYALRRVGLQAYLDAYRLHAQPRNTAIERHAAAMAYRLQGADPAARTTVVVSLNLLDPLLDAMQIPQDEPPQPLSPRHVTLANPDPSCLAEICAEMPYLQARYEQWRIDGDDGPLADRQRASLDLLREAEVAYNKSTGDRVTHWQRRLMARYTRNLARIQGDLIANLFDLTVAARAIVDDNYGWEVWELANRYPHQTIAPDMETIKISGDMVWLDTRRIRLRRRLPRPKQRLLPRGLKPRKKEATPGEWSHELHGEMICSYPPEDIEVESYGKFLRHKAKSLLSEERLRVQQFTTSLLDGIDLRETLRNWHQGKIYVREGARIAGDVGALVMIFDPDHDDRYTYMATWQGEHQNESDMAFYATDPAQNVVGPGVGRSEYGGFLMTLPPKRMAYVWSDPDYAFAESKPETLLMAALDYSVEKHVVYVAAKPPRSIFRSIAARLNRSIIYLPIGALSSGKLKKIRVVHILDSHARRESAKDFIW